MEASNTFMINPSSSCCLKKPMSSSMVGFVSFRNTNSLKIGGFWDKGQLEYYKSSIRIRCGSDKRKVKVEEKLEKKKKKKGVKLLKGLSRDLSDFYGMGFGLDSEYYQQNLENHQGVADQVKFKMMAEAAELLLEQVRSEDKELKKKMKMEEKKKKKKTEEKRSAMAASCLESSSSESSDSESDNEMVVDLNRLNRCLQLPQQQLPPPPASICTVSELHVNVPTLQENGDVYLVPSISGEETVRQREAESVIFGCSIRLNEEKNRVGAELGGMVGKKIEVCMGGKCKKSGAARLMEEFERAVGLNDEIVVCGCKCMGKCKEGPNVRVMNSPSSASGNHLCLGVGVEEVGLIVSNFFGDESQKNANMGIIPAACCNIEKVLV